MGYDKKSVMTLLFTALLFSLPLKGEEIKVLNIIEDKNREVAHCQFYKDYFIIDTREVMPEEEAFYGDNFITFFINTKTETIEKKVNYPIDLISPIHKESYKIDYMKVEIYDVNTGRKKKELEINGDPGFLFITHNERYLCITQWENIFEDYGISGITFVDLNNNYEMKTFPVKNVLGVALTDDDKYLYVLAYTGEGYEAQSLKIFKIDIENKTMEYKELEGVKTDEESVSNFSILISPEDSLIYVISPENQYIINMVDYSLIKNLSISNLSRVKRIGKGIYGVMGDKYFSYFDKELSSKASFKVDGEILSYLKLKDKFFILSRDRIYVLDDKLVKKKEIELPYKIEDNDNGYVSYYFMASPSVPALYLLLNNSIKTSTYDVDFSYDNKIDLVIVELSPDIIKSQKKALRK